MRQLRYVLGISLFLLTAHWSHTTAHATDYYIAPNGNNSPPSSGGGSQSHPWATFNYVWQYLGPGDSLIVMDGTYFQEIYPSVTEGLSGNPIVIKAQHDGQAIIDGQGARVPVNLESWPHNDYFVFEGLVFQNSFGSVIRIQGNNNIFRRVSAYNANTDGNDHAIMIWGSNNLIEDCIAAGSGRKMIMSYSPTGTDGTNTIRRCLADWHDWRGLNWCSGHWPWGDEIQIYHGSDNIIENSISLGSHSGNGINIQNQSGGTFQVNNNQILGSIVINGGMDPSNLPSGLRFWGTNPAQVNPHTWDVPNPSCGPWDKNWGSGFQRSGFSLYGSHMFNTRFADVLATNNAGSGISLAIASNYSGTIDRASVVNNSLDGSYGNASGSLNPFTVTNSHIPGTNFNDPSQGAKLNKRYVNGQLTNQDLWPWPMEDRVKSEYASRFGINNYSITCEVGKIINQHTNYPITNINVNDYCNADTPPSPTPIIGDLDADSDVDFLDLLQLILGFNANSPNNFNLSGLVDIFDFNTLISNL